MRSKPCPSFFRNLTLADWLLAGLFLLVLMFLGNSLAPGIGVLIGLLAGLALLYLAKRRRDRMQERNGKDQE